MAENIQEYAVSIDFDAAISKINKLQQATKKLNQSQVNGLKHQISLQKQLNALQGITGEPTPPKPTPPKPTVPRKGKSEEQLVESQIQKDKKAAEQRSLAMTKVRLRYEKNQRREMNDMQEAAVKKLTSATGAKKDEKYYKTLGEEWGTVGPQISKEQLKANRKAAEQEAKAAAQKAKQIAEEEAALQKRIDDQIAARKKAQQVREDTLARIKEKRDMEEVERSLEADRVEAKRVKDLDKEIDRLRSLKGFNEQNLTLKQKQAKDAIIQAINTAKNADELKRATRHHTRVLNSMEKQNFLMERMKSSSKQFAGNMIGAFAVAAGFKVLLNRTKILSC